MYKESREWRGIKGFPAYEVSDVGMVRRITPDGHRPVKLRKKKNGYVEVKSRIRRKVDKPFKGYVFKRRDSY